MFEEIKPMQTVEYDILCEFDRVCRKYNLKYFLAFGTMLGAARHQGFIPWDDDVDVFMPPEDYDKLEQLHCFEEPYFLQSYESEPESGLCYKKLRRSDTTLIAGSLADKHVNHGINIDIYTLYHLADGKFQRKCQYLQAMIYMLMTVGRPPKNQGGMFAAGARIILSIIPDSMKSKIRMSSYRKMTKYQSVSTENVFPVIGSIKVMKDIYKREWFQKAEMLKFEESVFPVPSGYKEFLKEHYGADFMELPPKEEQGVKLNDIVAWSADIPFAEYEKQMNH